MVKKRTLDLSKVLAATSELIDKQGIAAVTFPNLAKKLGIRSQSLYHYIDNRTQLLSLVGANRIKALNENLKENLVGMLGQEAILKFCDLIRDYLLEDSALAAILYHLNEYERDAEINIELLKVIELGTKLKSDEDEPISVHALVGAVLGYVFFDRSAIFSGESKEERNSNYHQMILRLIETV